MAESKPVSAIVSFLTLAAIVAFVAVFVGMQLWSDTSVQREGFAGPSKGAGAPDCLRTSSEAAALYDLFASRTSTTGEGADDLREFTLLLGKLSCLKRDLLGTAGIVEATRTQPFTTSLDLEPVAETAARCFAKTIPKRDLDLSFEKWTTRGSFLLRRLCTSYSFNEADKAASADLFSKVLADVKDVSYSRCLKGEAVIAGQPAPRMVSGYEPEGAILLREYNGYY